MNRSVARILVALDASPNSLAALQAAAQMAEALRAELSGLFVEDETMLRLAALPVAREVDRLTGAVRQIDQAQVEQQFRAQARRAQQALEQAAQRVHVNWSFRVTRGPVSAEVVAAAGEVDMITLGAVGWAPGIASQLGSTVRAVLDQAPCLTLVPGGRGPISSNAYVPYDGSAGAQRALDVAKDFVVRRDGRLTVLMPPSRDARSHVLWGEVTTRLAEHATRADYLHIEDHLESMVAALGDAGGGVLILPVKHPLAQSELCCAVLGTGRYALLFVR